MKFISCDFEALLTYTINGKDYKNQIGKQILTFRQKYEMLFCPFFSLNEAQYFDNLVL